MTAPVLDKHIEITPGVASGKPRIAGHRITVQNIVIWHEHMGKSADEISADHNVTLADVYAALTYYFDHRDEINKHLHKSSCEVLEAKSHSLARTGRAAFTFSFA